MSAALQADVKDLYAGGRLLPVDEWPEVWRRGVGRVASIESTEEVSYVGRGKNRKRIVTAVVNKVRLGDPTKIIELAGKHTNVRAFREQMELLLPKVTVRDLTGRKQPAA